MAALLLYGGAVGMPSSRRLERTTVAVRVLTGGEHPDHTRISEFRREHLGAVAKLFVQVQVCQKAGMVRLGHVALDGTKVKANASKNKAMSFEWMVTSERELAAEIKALLQRADQVDRDGDARYGRGVRGHELPDELRGREQRLERLRAAKAALEREAAAAHAAKHQETSTKDDGGTPTNGSSAAPLPRHLVKTAKHGAPAPKGQRNFIDPGNRNMKHQGGCIQGYNGQIAVDDRHQVVVAPALTPITSHHLGSMLWRARASACRSNGFCRNSTRPRPRQ